MNDITGLYARIAIYGKRYGISLTDYGEITVSDMDDDIGKKVYRKLTIDQAGPVLIELWEKLQKEKEFNNGLKQLEEGLI